MSKYETTHLSPSEIDRLRLQAFVTNSQDDMNAYYRAASLYFQQRDVRAMNRADRIEELEAKLRKSALQELSALGQASEAYQAQLAAEAELERAVDMLRILGIADATLAELKGQDDE